MNACLKNYIILECFRKKLTNSLFVDKKVPLNPHLIFKYKYFVVLSECGNSRPQVWLEITDHQEFKYTINSRNNVMVCFYSSEQEAAPILKVVKEVADLIRGEGTIVLMNCKGASKKLCKRLKANPKPYLLRHYYKGKVNKDYDRKNTAQSMVHFLRDPTGDLPWEEEDTSVDVVHVLDPNGLAKLLKTEKKPIMMMFYAPWCSYCKLAKPEYAAAATDLKDTHVLAALDVHRPENLAIRLSFNITSLPTLIYIRKGEVKYQYEGKLKKDSIIKFMKNPSEFSAEPDNVGWSVDKTDVVHLSSDNFDKVLVETPSLLIAFYAPWCGHCKKLKPEYEKAAEQLKLENIPGVLAAVDATKDPDLARKFDVRGYPTIKYFSNGIFKWDLPYLRESAAIVDYMTDPKEPAPQSSKETNWEDEPSAVDHLNIDSFKPFLKKKSHALVIFYAPWCGYCKTLKPEFIAAAEEFKEKKDVSFAAVDCTKYSVLCQQNGVNGFPTLKYYHHYNKEPDTVYSNGRKKEDLISFMSKRIESKKKNAKEEL